MSSNAIEFDLKAAAQNTATNSTKGIVMLVINDTVEGLKDYKRKKNVTDKYSDANKKIIDRCFTKYGIKRLKVICYNAPGTIKSALDKISGIKFNYLACPSATEDVDKKAIVDFIKDEHNSMRYPAEAVVHNYKADYENVISVKIDSIDLDGEVIDGSEYAVDLACMCATCSIKESLTNKLLDGVKSVTLIDPNEDEDSITETGHIFVKYDEDFEAYVLSDAVNTKTTIDESKENDSIKEIRVVEILNTMLDTLKVTFKKKFQSKTGGSYTGRKLIRDYFNTYFNSMAKTGALNADMQNKCFLDVEATKEYLEGQGIDTTDMKDEDVLKYDIGDKLFLNSRIYVLRTVEKMKFVLQY